MQTLISEPRLAGAFALETLCTVSELEPEETSPVLLPPRAESTSSIRAGRAHCAGESGSSSPRALLCPWAQTPRALEAIEGRHSSVHPGPLLRGYREPDTILDAFLLDNLMWGRGATATILSIFQLLQLNSEIRNVSG